MKEMNAYDDEKYMYNRKQVWLRDDYVPQYWNHLYQPDFDLQVCIIGRDTFKEKISEIKTMYTNKRIDFFLIDSSGEREQLCKFLDDQGFDRMRCYTIKDLTRDQMLKYFNYIFKMIENTIVFG
jgi:hypothetical protein